MFRPHRANQLSKWIGEIRRTSSKVCTNAVLDFEDIPTSVVLPVVGSRLAVWAAGSSKKFHEYIDKRHKELGPIYRQQLGNETGTFVADPEAIKSIFLQEGKYPVHIVPQEWKLFNREYGYSRGLFFMDGPEWLKYRKILNRILLKGDLKWAEDACDVVIEDFIKRLKRSVDNREVENLDEKLYRTFVDVLISVLLGSESYFEHRKFIETLVEQLTCDISTVLETTNELQMLPTKWAFKLGLPQWMYFEKSMRNALTVTNSLLDELTSMSNKNCGLLMKMREENISDVQIKAIVADMILAAADTTAYTMQWMLYLVAKNLDVQDKIRGELSNPDSSYSKYVLKETLRLYPVAPFLTRFLPLDSVIAGYRIPRNSLIVMSIYTTGRDEKYFKNAAKFNPDRWERGADKQVTTQASLPFAVGVRSCIGRRLAEYELQKMLTEMVKNFNLKLCNTNEIEMVMKMVAVPSERVRLKLEKI